MIAETHKWEKKWLIPLRTVMEKGQEDLYISFSSEFLVSCIVQKLMYMHYTIEGPDALPSLTFYSFP